MGFVVGDIGAREQVPGICSASRGNPAAHPPLWMDVPSAEAPAYAGMTLVRCMMTGVFFRS